MKKLFLLLAVIGLSQLVFGQNYRLNQNSYQKVSVSFMPGTLSVQDISIPEGEFTQISLSGYGSSYEPGAPQLPQFSRMLETPVCDSVIVHVVNAEYVDYPAGELGVNHPLYPVQISTAKNQPNPNFIWDQAIYSKDEFYALPLVRVEKAGVKRNTALATVHVSPVQYNPVSQIIRIYTRFDVEFTFANADMAQTYALKQYSSPYFELDKKTVINKIQGTRDEISSLPVKYLILGHSMFADNEDLAAFVAWKKRLGYVVEVKFTDDPQVGNSTTSIKNFIQSKFDNPTQEDPAPTYLLFLGDREQFPAFIGQADHGHITDLYYATTVGSDYIPDCYYGRLSATNNEQLSNQIEKIMMYEQYTMPDPSYLGRAVLIAGTDEDWSPTHANGQINYISNNYINTDNPEHTYTNVMAHLYNCSSQAALIRSEVSEGAGLVNYTAHGDVDCWFNPSFTNLHVSEMQNKGMYGLMIGNCCQSGNFKTSECFGEALLRAHQKGAMGYIGASNNSYWGEDFYWAVGVRSNITPNPTYMADALGAYDKLFHQHNEDHSEWVSTISGMVTAGNMAVQSSSSSLKQYYWEIYHCFGDPSVQIFVGVPHSMQVTAAPFMMLDDSTYTVQSLPPYAYVALTFENDYVAAAFADANGHATLHLPSVMNVGLHELVVLAQNYIPYFMDVQVVPPYGPYVIPTVIETSPNTKYQEGNTVHMDLTLFNAGVVTASDVYATLTPNQSVTMLQDSVFVGDLNTENIADIDGAFSFVMPYVQDGDNISFSLAVHWADTTITRTVKVKAILPKVVLTDYYTSLDQNITYSYRPGDQVTFVFNNKNKGHLAVDSGKVDLTSNYSGVKVISPSSSIDGLVPEQSFIKSFDVSIADTVPDCSLVQLYYHTLYGGEHRIDTLTIKVGGAFDDFESGDFSHLDWEMNNYPWVVTSIVHNSGYYAARSANYLANSSKSKMTIHTSTTEPSQLSYFRKVSSESGYDFFILYVNDTKIDEVSGDVDWTQVTIDVPAGDNTIVFSYEKDYSANAGSDCAFIDDVILPSDGISVIEDVEDVVGVHVYPETHAAVYPNPAIQWVNVESELPVSKVVLFDINGRIVKTLDGAGETCCQVSMNDMPTGMYLLQVTFGDKQIRNFKIIKK